MFKISLNQTCLDYGNANKKKDYSKKYVKIDLYF